MPKQWLINVVYSGIGEDFSIFVKRQIEARNSKVTKEKNLMVNMDPEIMAAFQASTHVSRKCMRRGTVIQVFLFFSFQGY